MHRRRHHRHRNGRAFNHASGGGLRFGDGAPALVILCPRVGGRGGSRGPSPRPTSQAKPSRPRPRGPGRTSSPPSSGPGAPPGPLNRGPLPAGWDDGRGDGPQRVRRAPTRRHLTEHHLGTGGAAGADASQLPACTSWQLRYRPGGSRSSGSAGPAAPASGTLAGDRANTRLACTRAEGKFPFQVPHSPRLDASGYPSRPLTIPARWR